MMTALQTIAVAFAMFSALPMPQFDWNAKNMRYALCAFPLVGAVCGALWCLCGMLPLPALARAAGFCLVPVWVTGGIHLDGYADTCDALSSYGDTAKKLEILKDPHCGAFAVIRLCSYFAAYFALCGCVQFTPRVGALWALALVGERALSGLAVAAFPLAKNTGLAHTFATAADRVNVRRALAVLCAAVAAALLALGRAYRKARARRPGFDERTRAHLEELARLEGERCPSMDRAADAFAVLLAGAAEEEPDPVRRRVLRQLLYHLGRWIYLVDAADDLKKDVKSGSYNPLVYRFHAEGGTLTAEDRAALAATLDSSVRAMAAAFELADFGPWRAIIESVVYEGLYAVGAAVLNGTFRKGRRRKQRKAGA